jgi:CRP/FNR family cyclic AMP-dependent transcriptional regulator
VSAKALKHLTPLKVVSILSRLPLFHLLTPGEKQHIAESKSLFYHIPADDEFIKVGEVDDRFLVLLSGSAVIVHSGEALTEISAGDFVGETGFIGHNTRLASVVAQTDTIALRFTRKSFQHLPIRAREIIKDHIIEGLVQRVELLNKKVIATMIVDKENELIDATHRLDLKKG